MTARPQLVPAICATCGFWSWDRLGPDYRRDEPQIYELIAGMRGQCQRRAPVRDAAVFMSAAFPTISGTGWCGEWSDWSMPRTITLDSEREGQKR